MMFDKFGSKREMYEALELKIQKIKILLGKNDNEAVHLAIQDTLSRMTSDLIIDEHKAIETEQCIVDICNKFLETNKSYDIMLLAIRDEHNNYYYTYCYRIPYLTGGSTEDTIKYNGKIVDIYYIGYGGKVWELPNNLVKQITSINLHILKGIVPCVVDVSWELMG